MEKKDIKETKQEVVTSKQEEPKVDPITKELEELRKFKSEVEAREKAKEEKPEEVKVSDTFFSTKENVVKQEQSEKYGSKWKEFLDIGVPYNKGWEVE